MKIFTAAQMRAFDQAATEQYNIPSIVLMENAALRVVEFLEHKFAPLAGKKIVVLCGKGNNGGDGFAIARRLLPTGCALSVFVATSLENIKHDAMQNFQMLQQALEFNSDASLTFIDAANAEEAIASGQDIWLAAHQADIVVDALLGTGFHGDIRDERITVGLTCLHVTRGARVAVDIPSAVSSDSGEAAPPAKQADRPLGDYTVTLAAPKRGMFLRDGLQATGEIWVGNLGTPSAMDDIETGCECLNRAAARRRLPHRHLDSHKGETGRVVLFGGSYGMSGAPTLAARAALRIGAGLAIACLPDKILPIFASAFSEATSHPLPNDEMGRLIPAAADRMAEHWKDAHAVALGPGLSRSDGALDFARRVVKECPHPLVVDADALYALRAIEQAVKERRAPTVLTPHPGEMGELMEMSAKDVQADRIGTAIACAKKFNAIVVLKGSRSIISLPDGLTYINLTGNSGMATGGAGDVLTGTIAGLIGQLKDAVAATLLGVYAHGLAGDIAFRSFGNGLIAGDIVESLPLALREIATIDAESVNSHLRRLT